MIGEWISTDPTNTISWFCKFRIFILYSCRTTSVWLLVFATIDRWFSSSTKLYRRRLSSYKNACHNILIISFLSLILWIEILFCYDANLINTWENSCMSIVYASSTVAISSLLMLIIGLLTIRSHQAVRPFLITTRVISQGNRRSEGSLTRMLLLQIILLTLCSIPQAIHQFYLSFTIDVTKNSYRLAIENSISSNTYSYYSVIRWKIETLFDFDFHGLLKKIYTRHVVHIKSNQINSN